MNKLKYKFGEIYLTKFHPEMGSEMGKYRPAVVINVIVNKIDEKLVMICPITSTTRKNNNKYELLLKKDEHLDKNSYMLLWYLRVIDVNRLEYKIGSVPKDIALKAKVLLKELFSA